MDQTAPNTVDLNSPSNLLYSAHSTQSNPTRLAVITEGRLLTFEDLELAEGIGTDNDLDENSDRDQVSDDEKGENTPLLRSQKSETSLESDFNTIANLTSSQASILMPSIQLSLLSSKQHSFMSSQNRKSRDNSFGNSGGRHSRSVTVSLIEKISEDGKAPVFLSYWNMCSLIQSTTGILGMPYAMMQCGFLAIPVLLLVGLLCVFTALRIVDCLYDVSPKSKARKRVRDSYSEIAFAVWGTYGARMVDIMIVLFEYSACVLFLIVFSSGLEKLCRSSFDLKPSIWALITAAALLPVVLIRKLSVLAWISIISQLATVSCCLILLGFCIGHYEGWKFSNTMHLNLEKLPIAIGMIVWSYLGHAIFPNIEGSMRQPKKYKKIACGTFASSTIVKLLVGFLCTLLFGAETKTVVIINLTPANSGLLSYVVTILPLINMYCIYPLDMFLVSSTLDNICLPKLQSCASGQKYNFLWTFFTRTALVGGTLCIALAVPQFGLLMSITGSVIGACLAFVFPCIFHTVLKRNIKWPTILINVIVALLGVTIGIVGIVSNVSEIKKLY